MCVALAGHTTDSNTDPWFRVYWIPIVLPYARDQNNTISALRQHGTQGCSDRIARTALLPSALFAGLPERARCTTSMSATMHHIYVSSRNWRHALYARRRLRPRGMSRRLTIIDTGDLRSGRAARTGSIERSPMHSPCILP